MLIVDASCLTEVLLAGQRAGQVRDRLEADADHAAPHIIDVEVFGIVRREHRLGTIDTTGAALALRSLQEWRGIRFGHVELLRRAWELRYNVRGWDAMYVALAEACGAPLLTLDVRLAQASGPRCTIEVPDAR
jgi:predicted nucleic acid-binding protein